MSSEEKGKFVAGCVVGAIAMAALIVLALCLDMAIYPAHRLSLDQILNSEQWQIDTVKSKCDTTYRWYFVP
jgi:hypothetical protein